jgi:hypothetical protein
MQANHCGDGRGPDAIGTRSGWCRARVQPGAGARILIVRVIAVLRQGG